MRHYPKEIVWKRTISYFFAIFKGLTNKPIPTMNNYVFEDVNNVKRRLYLNSDIVDFVITYLMCGNKRSYYPKINNIDKNVDEAYILRLFKSDRDRNVGRYNTVSQEYKAVYQYGRINYGTFPLSLIHISEPTRPY